MRSADNNLDLVRDRLARLAQEGKALIASRYRSEISHQEFVDAARFRGWRAGCAGFLHEALGAESSYVKEFEFCCDSPYLSAVARGQAVLVAVREYIDAGPVARVEELVASEVFNDFLAIVRRQIDQGRLVAAAAVLGAVLEDVMRRLARNRRIAFREDLDEPATLNLKLNNAGVYGAATSGKIDGWVELAARAVRGEFNGNADDAAREEVRRMLAGVRDFVTDYLL
ncbi:MAG: hypothetical protein ACREQN_01805 [Candidatus Binataceae bacterium]